MMFGKNALLTGCLFVLSSPLLANSKTLLIDGVNAAVHGDVSLDKGPWQNNESFSALRLRVGFQLIRLGPVGVTIGYQKVGFYTAEKKWSQNGTNKTHFDYRGPVAELHVFPDKMFSFSVAAHKGAGFSYLKGTDAAGFGIDCAGDTACDATTLERSELDINEVTAQVNYMFSPGLQLFIGAGNRHIKGTPSYEVNRTAADGVNTSFISVDGTSSWNVSSKFFMLGIRGSTL